MSGSRGCLLWQTGSEALLCGLQDPHLNGKHGVILGHCPENSRWAVQVGERCVAVKEDNLKPVDGCKNGKDRRMCRYGDRCWRPNCRFSHRCEQARSEKWAKAWSTLLDSESAASSLASEGRSPKCSTCVGDVASLTASLEEHDKSLVTLTADMDALRKQTVELQDRIVEFEGSPMMERGLNS